MTQQELFDNLNGNTCLSDVQLYIKKVANLRGFTDESVQSCMLLLLEEVGELAKAVRKHIKGMSVDEERLSNYDTVESEVADIFIVLLSICNRLEIDLVEAFMEKEKINIERKWIVNENNIGANIDLLDNIK